MISTQKRILVVVDDLNTRWLSRATSCDRPTTIEILPLFAGSEAYVKANRASLDAVEAGCLSLSRFAECAREAVQSSYPTLLYELPRLRFSDGTTMLELLSVEDVNLWWLTDTSEKSALRYSLVNDLYGLELLRAASAAEQYDEIWISVSCPARREALLSFQTPDSEIASIDAKRWAPLSGFEFASKLLARRGYQLVRLFLQRAIVRSLLQKARARTARVLLFSSFPTLWAQPFSSNARDKFYGSLHDVVSSWKPAAYIVLLFLPIRELWWHRHEIRQAFQSRAIFPLVGFSTLADLSAVVSPRYLRPVLGAMRRIREMQRYQHGAFDIRSIVTKELESSLRGSELSLNTVWVRCWRRALTAFGAEVVIHSGEFQPVEKALWYGIRTTSTRAVAFQHSTCTPMFTNYHFADGELAEYVKERHPRTDMPLPWLFTSTGRYASSALAAAGFPPDRTAVCGAIRYRGLMELRLSGRTRVEARRQLDLDPAARVIVLATASKRQDNVSMVDSLTDALAADNGEPLTVLVKCHPLMLMEADIARALSRSAASTKVRVFSADVPLHDLIAVSDVMVTNSSASGVEALALDVVPVFFHNPAVYDVSVLYSLAESIVLACDSDELKSALKDCWSDTAMAKRRARWASDVQALFHVVDRKAEERLVTFVRDSLVWRSERASA